MSARDCKYCEGHGCDICSPVADALRADNARLKEELTAAKEKVDGLREDYRMLRGYADTIEEKRNAARAELADLRQKQGNVICNLNSRVKDLEVELATARNGWEVQQGNAERAHAELTALREWQDRVLAEAPGLCEKFYREGMIIGDPTLSHGNAYAELQTLLAPPEEKPLSAMTPIEQLAAIRSGEFADETAPPCQLLPRIVCESCGQEMSFVGEIHDFLPPAETTPQLCGYAVEDVPVPGEVFPVWTYIREEMDKRGWDTAKFSRVTGLTVRTIHAMSRREPITTEIAVALARAFGGPMEVWLIRDREWQERQQDAPAQAEGEAP